MLKSIKILSVFIIILLSLYTYGTESGYEIKIKIRGYSDSTMLLTSYFGEKIKLVDTTYSIKSGEYLFTGEKKLPGGIYMAVSSDKKKLFEFIIGEDQKFILQTDTADFIQNMKVSGSKDNKIFYSYLRNNEKQYKLNQELTERIDSLKSASMDVKSLEQKRDSLNDNIVNYKLEVINNNEGTFVSTLLKAMRDIEVPDSINNSTDSTLAFWYYRDNFFTNIDLSDSSLLRTPVYMRKVKQYFDQVVVFNPDSVIVAIDYILKEARPSRETIGYLVWHFISEYQNPKFMGFDKVFVHLVDEYFSKEEIENTTPSILTSLQERADKLRPILLEQPAPNMLLIDTLGNLRSFSEINSNYVVIFFWDSECGICGKEITELIKLYGNSDYDVEIYAVNVNSDLEKWKEAVIEKKLPGINVNGTRSATKDFHDLYDIYGTPVIYVLDKNKRIIAKRIGAGKIAEFIDSYEKIHNKSVSN